MKTKTTDKLLSEITRLKRENQILKKENKSLGYDNSWLSKQNNILKEMGNVTNQDLKEYIKKYNKLVNDIKKCYPTFTIN